MGRGGPGCRVRAIVVGESVIRAAAIGSHGLIAECVSVAEPGSGAADAASRATETADAPLASATGRGVALDAVPGMRRDTRERGACAQWTVEPMVWVAASCHGRGRRSEAQSCDSVAMRDLRRGLRGALYDGVRVIFDDARDSGAGCQPAAYAILRLLICGGPAVSRIHVCSAGQTSPTRRFVPSPCAHATGSTDRQPHCGEVGSVPTVAKLGAGHGTSRSSTIELGLPVTGGLHGWSYRGARRFARRSRVCAGC